LALGRDITEKKRAEEALRRSAEHLLEENLLLKVSMKERYRFGEIIGKSPAMQAVYNRILEAAHTDAGVIIYGESGTGKELVARAVHLLSDRKKRAFVPVNSGAIPESLLESEFFGYKKGAFTGATADKQGFLDIADGGILFLDEVGEIPVKMQVKLLRAIDDGSYTPVGSSQVENTDVRVVAATNRDLRELVKDGRIREDFFYRIHIIPIYVPPLRERKEDLPLLIDHFMKTGPNKPKKTPVITGKTLDALFNYDWPGNVRELKNTLERYITLNKIDFMTSNTFLAKEPDTLADSLNSSDLPDHRSAMASYEKKLIIRALEQNRWHREKAAKCLVIPRRTFFRKLKNYELI